MMVFGLSTIVVLTMAFILGVRSQYVTTNGMQFALDGVPFNFAGVNVYDTAFQTNQYSEDVVNAVVADGYRVLRLWAFNDYDSSAGPEPAIYLQSWAGGQPTPNTGDNGLGMLDHVVKQAEAVGLKLILTLVNNWQEYGGMDVYVNNAGTTYHDTFYNDGRINEWYKAYITAVVSRYTSSPAILSWELANEARCSGSKNPQSPSGCNADVITSWVRDMSSFIKSIDPNHMVTFGMEGFFNRPATANWVYEYDGGSGQDYDALMALDSIDFGTIHLYIGYNSGYQDIPWSLQFLEDHDNCSSTYNKPSVLEELGVSRTDPTYKRQDVFDQWNNYIISSAGINGDMPWGSLVVDADCPGQDDYAICPTDVDYADLVTDWVPKMNGKT